MTSSGNALRARKTFSSPLLPWKFLTEVGIIFAMLRMIPGAVMHNKLVC